MINTDVLACVANTNKLYEEDIALFDSLPQNHMWSSFPWNVQTSDGLCAVVQ